MSKNREFSEEDIIRLLDRWQRRNYSYPAASQMRRRTAFLTSAAALLVGGAGHAGLAGESLLPSSHAAVSPMTIGMKIAIGFISTVALAIGSFVGVYLYNERETLVDLLRGNSISTQTMAAPNSPASSSSRSPASSTPSLTSTSTVTPTPTATLPPGTPTENGNQPPQMSQTPAATATNSGQHYGQTKTPKPPKPTKTPRK